MNNQQISIELYKGDCLEIMDVLIAMGVKVDAIITSPPYDDIKNYDNTNTWNFEVFKSIADRLYKVVADKTDKGSESGTSFKQALYFKEIGFNLHDTMIYRKLNYQPLTHNRYEQEFEYMFVLSKGKPKTFNPIKIPCKYAGTESWGKPSFYKTDNDNLTKVKKMKINDEKIKGNIFEYHTGSVTDSKKYQHPAMFPVDLAKDQITSWTNENDTILDPFMGSGTTGVACVKTGRNFIGVEIVNKYFQIAKERINDTRQS